MRRFRLSTLLIALNVGLLLLAVGGVAIVAVRLLERFADEQALARVSQAAAIAEQQLGDTTAATRTSAQLLAERPTLRRLIEQRDIDGMAAFLDQFQRTSQLDATAVVRDGTVIAASDAALPWSTFRANTAAIVPIGGRLLITVGAPIVAQPGTSVIVVRRLDEPFSANLSQDIGLSVAIVEREAALLNRDALRASALSTDQQASARVDRRSSYVADRPLRSPDGATVGLIEVELPTSAVVRSVRQFVVTLVGLAIGLVVLAGVASLLIGQRLAWPLRSLAKAAARIGRGDLATPIPVKRGGEIGALAMTFEEMRWRLLRLTEDLRRQQAEAEAIITGIVEGVFSVDRERRIRYLNPQAAALLGVAPEQAIGQFCGDVLHPQGVNGVPPCADHCPIVHARFRGGARAIEHLLLPDGQRRSVVITSAAAVGEMQMQVMRDETEIEATRRLRDSILANISHEFRTPLSAQLAAIELLLDQLPDLTTEQIERLVRSQQRGTLRLQQLIDNLLESARIEAGQLGIRHQQVAIDDVIETALELVRPLFEQRGQIVEVDLPHPLPVIYGDAPRLTQVFVNLLGNANKFAPGGSTVRIGGATSGSDLTLWVADRGPGLPAVAGTGLFQRFVRASQDEPEQSGVGLGLWLVKSIVERHGGHVEADTGADGTRMSIVLPVEQPHEITDRR